MLGRDFDGDSHGVFSNTERAHLRIIGNKMYEVKTFTVNYTTYDVRRDSYTVNPSTPNCNIMVKSQEVVNHPNPHPFYYAQVLGVFHANICHVAPGSKHRAVRHIEFLWVRWYGLEPGRVFGPKAARLPKIGFIEDTDDFAFGFLDPDLVLRGCHLIPAFVDGRTGQLLKTDLPTRARKSGETTDWTSFYVMMYVFLSSVI